MATTEELIQEQGGEIQILPAMLEDPDEIQPYEGATEVDSSWGDDE